MWTYRTKNISLDKNWNYTNSNIWYYIFNELKIKQKLKKEEGNETVTKSHALKCLQLMVKCVLMKKLECYKKINLKI